MPGGGSVRLLDAAGHPVSTVTVRGQGTYAVTTTGVVTFTPAKGFAGTAQPVRFRVTDGYGQSATGTYAPTVRRAASPVVVGKPSLKAPQAGPRRSHPAGHLPAVDRHPRRLHGHRDRGGRRAARRGRHRPHHRPQRQGRRDAERAGPGARRPTRWRVRPPAGRGAAALGGRHPVRDGGFAGRRPDGGAAHGVLHQQQRPPADGGPRLPAGRRRSPG
ncbi:hypothetical protein GCM10025868_27780 [Angustibacter aerolatus]|uniref:CshA domain-containing protein n=1 Tax=Angustibacter aerolatus TaxID=1162965 RepID=A0ABQ6JJD1_9ACTN|nr:Ig-like domain-containing protein [Angustibacter aerolatus]GMA87528.1 hypothetical protein GCM10025868_27780 [Angustibacter aerolatus]